jgi:hypothetical protein
MSDKAQYASIYAGGFIIAFASLTFVYIKILI